MTNNKNTDITPDSAQEHEEDKEMDKKTVPETAITGEQAPDSPYNEEEIFKKTESDDGWAEFFKTIIMAILLAVLIRTFFFEPFNIPSSSMKPTLLIGDYLFVSKTAYGYSKHSFPLSLAPIEGRIMASMPERGDIVVFKLPTNPRIDYIKRVIGLPGDTVQVAEGRLYLNGQAVTRQPNGLARVSNRAGHKKRMLEYIEVLPNGATYPIYQERDDAQYDNTRAFKVPPGHVFVMGDNRDNSQDSRVQDLVGYVPVENIVGRADFLFFSIHEWASFFRFWEWPAAIRYERIFMNINPDNLSSGT